MQTFLQRIFNVPVSLLQYLRGFLRAIINPLPRLYETAADNPNPQTQADAMNLLLAYYQQKKNPEAAYFVGLLSNDEHRHPGFFHRLRAIQAFRFGTETGFPGCSTQLVVAKLLQGHQVGCVGSLEQALFNTLRTDNPQDLNALARAGERLVQNDQPAVQQLGLKCLETAAEYNCSLACYWLGRLLLDAEIVNEDFGRAISLLRQAAQSGVPKAAQDLAVTLAATQPESQEPEEIIRWLLTPKHPAFTQAACEAGLRLVEIGRAIDISLLTELANTDAATCLQLVYHRLNSGADKNAAFDRKLSKAAHDHAQANQVHGYIALAVCHQVGLGSTIDLEMAYRCLAVAHSLTVNRPEAEELRASFAAALATLAYRQWENNNDQDSKQLCLQLAQLHQDDPECQAILQLLKHPGASHCTPLTELAESGASALALYHQAQQYKVAGQADQAKRFARRLALGFKDWRAYTLLAELYFEKTSRRAAVYTAMARHRRASII